MNENADKATHPNADNPLSLPDFKSPSVSISLISPDPFEVHMVPPGDIVSINLGRVLGIHSFDSDKIQPSNTAPNMVRIHPAGSETYCRGDKVESEVFVIGIDKKLREQIVEDTNFKEVRDINRVVADISIPTAVLLAQTARRFVLSGHAGGKMVAESIAILALTEALAGVTDRLSSLQIPKTLSKNSLNLVLDAIEENLSENIGPSELAALVGLSPYYFTRAFKKAIGISPHQYVMERRVARTRDALENGSESLADIAYGMGFSSQAHMTDVFKKRLGVTPGKYRKICHD